MVDDEFLLSFLEQSHVKALDQSQLTPRGQPALSSPNKLDTILRCASDALSSLWTGITVHPAVNSMMIYEDER